MGIFGTLIELIKYNNSKPEIEITVEDDYEYDPEEDLRKKQEGVLLRKQALEEAGVDLSVFSKKKAIHDATTFLDRFLPFWRELNVKHNRPSASLDPCNLTGTGKVPKNVVISQVIFDRSEPRSESVEVEISYLRNGDVNKADVTLWFNRICLTVSIRIVEDDYAITAASRYDLDRDFGKALYTGSSGNEQAMALIASSFEESKKGR